MRVSSVRWVKVYCVLNPRLDVVTPTILIPVRVRVSVGWLSECHISDHAVKHDLGAFDDSMKRCDRRAAPNRINTYQPPRTPLKTAHRGAVSLRSLQALHPHKRKAIRCQAKFSKKNSDTNAGEGGGEHVSILRNAQRFILSFLHCGQDSIKMRIIHR